jgi:hypothetical protein
MRPPYWSCAPGAEAGMESDDLLCSRNARLKKALVGRAQWERAELPRPVHEHSYARLLTI